MWEHFWLSSVKGTIHIAISHDFIVYERKTNTQPHKTNELAFRHYVRRDAKPCIHKIYLTKQKVTMRVLHTQKNDIHTTLYGTRIHPRRRTWHICSVSHICTVDKIMWVIQLPNVQCPPQRCSIAKAHLGARACEWNSAARMHTHKHTHMRTTYREMGRAHWERLVECGTQLVGAILLHIWDSASKKELEYGWNE